MRFDTLYIVININTANKSSVNHIFFGGSYVSMY